MKQTENGAPAGVDAGGGGFGGLGGVGGEPLGGPVLSPAVAGRIRDRQQLVQGPSGAPVRRRAGSPARHRSTAKDCGHLSFAAALPHRTHARSSRCHERRSRSAAARRGLPHPFHDPFGERAGVDIAETAIFPTESPVADSIAPQEMVGDGKAWGLCTALDLQDCNPDLIRNADHIRSYVAELCELIDMKRFGECQVVDFGSGRVAGYSTLHSGRATWRPKPQNRP